MSSEKRHVDTHRPSSDANPATPQSPAQSGDGEKEADRSLAGRPVDPNNATSKLKFPPGVEPEEAKDPGRQTPKAPPVDNRS